MISRKALAGALITLALSMFAGYVSKRTIRAAGKQSDRVAHAQAVLIRLEVTVGHVVGAETGARGFALTGKESFLEPYVSGIAARDGDLTALRQLTADSPDQQRSLNDLEGKLRSAYGFDLPKWWRCDAGRGFLSPGALEENKRRVDLVRTAIQELRTGVEGLLEQRSQTSRSAQRVTSLIALSGGILGLIFLALAWIAIRREIRANATLQERLEQRTAALQEENAKGAQMQEQLRASEEMYRLMLDGIKDYAVYMLNPKGEVASWNTGATRIEGYETNEVLGRHFACFHTEADRRENLPAKALQEGRSTPDVTRSGDGDCVRTARSSGATRSSRRCTTRMAPCGDIRKSSAMLPAASRPKTGCMKVKINWRR